MKFTYYSLVNGTLKCDHIKRLITLTSDYIKRLLLYNKFELLIYVNCESHVTGNEKDHGGRGLVCEPRDGQAQEVDGREVVAGQEKGNGEKDERPKIVQWSDEDRRDERGFVKKNVSIFFVAHF